LGDEAILRNRLELLDTVVFMLKDFSLDTRRYEFVVATDDDRAVLLEKNVPTGKQPQRTFSFPDLRPPFSSDL
jgi:hypothetical protein